MINIKLFQRGFIFYPSSNISILNKLPNYFITKNVNLKYSISFDKDYQVHINNDDKSYVIVIGIAIDTLNNTLDVSQISKNVKTFLNESGNIRNNINLLNYLDYLGGRFCLIIGNKDNVYVFNDACGMRSVFYHSNLCILSSHYNLLNIIANEKESEFYSDFVNYTNMCKKNKIRVPWCLPGNISPLENISQLVCNHFLDLSSHKMVRFFPRNQKILNFNISEASTYISKTITNTADLLVKSQFKIYQSLTMGNDSRMSLAAVKDYLKYITFFTYSEFRKKSIQTKNYDDEDRKFNSIFASKLAKQLGLNFVEIDLPTSMDPNDIKTLRINHYHSHIDNLIEGFKKSECDVGQSNTVHIRTNITELLRHSYFAIDKKCTVDELSSSLASWSMIYDKESDYYHKVTEYYKSYIDQTEFLNCGEYDYGDIFYMEYRMNQWMSAVLINQDSLFDTIILFNTRKILEYGMNIPRFWKEQNEMVYQIQELCWPDLMEFNHPNHIKSSEYYVDWFLTSCLGLINFNNDILGNSKFKVSSGNLGTTKIVESLVKPHLSGICFGFSSNYISRGDYIDISIPIKGILNKRYYIDVTVLNLYSLLSNNKDVCYQILINDRILYQLETNIFSRPNQIIIMYTNKESSDFVLKIRLLAQRDAFRKYNGIMDIQHVIVRQEHIDVQSSDFVISTYDKFK